MKILLLIAAWQRRGTARICYRGVKRMVAEASASGFDIKPMVVISQSEDFDLATSFDFDCISAPNKPLGKKMNIGIQVALRYSWQYLMQLGSDDLLAKGFFDWNGWIGQNSISSYLQKETPFFGCTELFVYNSKTGAAKYHNTLSPFGAGRFIRRDVVEKTVRQKGYLWEPERNYGLDFSSERMIMDCHDMRDVRIMPAHNHKFPMVLDIKDGENIHSFEEIPGQGVTDAQRKWMYEAFPELMALKLQMPQTQMRRYVQGNSTPSHD